MRGAAALMITVLLLCAGCAGRQQPQVPDDPDQVARAVLEQVSFSGELVRAGDDVAGEYYWLDEQVTDHAIYIDATGGTPEEVAVLKSADTHGANEILRARWSGLERRFQEYLPGEMPKLENAVFLEAGDLVVMVISGDPETARDAAGAALEQ